MRLTRVILSIILISALFISLYLYFVFLPNIAKKMLVEKTIQNEVNYFISLKKDNCQAIETKDLEGKPIEILSEQGNANLLYGFVELYKIKNNVTFLNLADEQANCLERKILPLEFDPIARRFPFIKNLTYEERQNFISQINLGITPDTDINYWGNILQSLSDFYAIKKQNPSYLKEIADHIISKLENETFLKDGTVKGKAILSLVYYYDVSKDSHYLEKAKFYLNAIPIKSFENYRFIYYEIYSRDSNFSIDNSVFKEVIALQNKDGSVGDIDKNFTTLMFSWNMHLCQQFLKNPECKEAFLKSFEFLIKQVENEQGLVISGERKFTELDSLLAIVLVRNTGVVVR